MIEQNVSERISKLRAQLAETKLAQAKQDESIAKKKTVNQLGNESYLDSVKQYEEILLSLGKRSKGCFGERLTFESVDDLRADYDENTFKDRVIQYKSWG